MNDHQGFTVPVSVRAAKAKAEQPAELQKKAQMAW